MAGERGYSHLELMLALTLLLIFISGALKVLIGFSAESEKMDMEQVLRNLKQSILVTVAEHMVESDLYELQRLQGSNPVQLLRSRPNNYIGERGDLDERPPAGYWYYNYDRQALIYRVIHARSFRSQGKVVDEAAFKLNLVFTDNNNNGQFDRGVDVVQSLKLEPQAKYEWVN